jgi:filamentous hemagglutinin
MTTAEVRAEYEDAVRSLGPLCDAMLAAGVSEEEVARQAVDARNSLKHEYRKRTEPSFVRVIEARNQRRYGNPLGPGVEAMFEKYGSWRAVIAAAARPGGADLKPDGEGSLPRRS